MIKKSKHELSFLCDLSIFFFLFDFPFFNESILNLLSFCPLWFWISFTDAYFDISFGNYFFKIKKKKEKKIPKTTKRETCINGLSSAIKCKQRDIKQLSRGLLALNVDCWENMLFDINNLVFLRLFFCFFFFFFQLQDILIISRQQNKKDLHVYCKIEHWRYGTRINANKCRIHT